MKVESPVKTGLPSRISEWTTNHLPFSAIDKWRKVFITTFAAYIRMKWSPWDLKDKETLEVMQDCWDHIYQSTPAAMHRISGFHDVVFVLVSILTLSGYKLMGATDRVINDGRSYETPLPELPSRQLIIILGRSRPTPTKRDKRKQSSFAEGNAFYSGLSSVLVRPKCILSMVYSPPLICIVPPRVALL